MTPDSRAKCLEALSVFEQSDGKIDLMLTDVVMPRISGAELAGLCSVRPEMKVVCMSGDANDAILHHGFVGGRYCLLAEAIHSCCARAESA